MISLQSMPSTLASSCAPIVPELELSPSPERRRERAVNPGRILVADDEHLAALSVTESLRELGYTTVGPAHDGEHAIELGFSARPDLALLDVRMADELDGVDAARFLFAELAIPSVIVSAYSDARQVAEATVPGVFGYVVKPVTREQLRAAIGVAWARSNEQRTQSKELAKVQSDLADRMMIERAKRALVEELEIDEGAAMRQLRKLARDTRLSLAEIARSVLGR